MSSLRSVLRYSRFKNQSSRAIGAPDFQNFESLEFELYSSASWFYGQTLISTAKILLIRLFFTKKEIKTNK